ncbi:hypothetical protein ACQ4PT_046749 [Festuca glaucescens]
MGTACARGSTIRLLSNRSEEARDWTNTYTLVGRQVKSAYDLRHILQSCDGVISVWGIAGVGKSTLVRSVFCHAMLGLHQMVLVAAGKGYAGDYSHHGFMMYSWVDVPHPFNLKDFSRCFLLDFHSDDLQAKESAAVGIVQGQDPIQGCRRILHEHKCLVVMDGLRSTDDWDLIKAAFLPDSTESRIIVITNEKKVAMHCVDKEAQVVNVKGLNSHSALNLFNKMTRDCKELTPTRSEHIVAKCGGILKVMDAIGKLFAIKITPSGGQSEDMSREAKEQLNDINGDFMGTLEKDPKFHSLRGLFAWMSILTKGEGDDTVRTSQTADVDQISTPAEDTARVQEAVSDGVRTSTTSSWTRPRTLVSSWLSKSQKPRHDNRSVKVPVGIGNLTALHTLGVVNVAAGKAALKELKKLTQLRKLGVSGINREHWPDFCSAISGYAHLESLSVRVHEDKDGLFARFGDISEPPKTLKSLKAYGHIQISPVWLLQLQNIKKVNFGLSILTQGDIDELPLYRLLPLDNGYWNMFRVLEIECTSRLELSFKNQQRASVKVLKIQCNSGSSLQISHIDKLIKLEEVWLSGFYHDDLKQDLERQLSSHPNEPVLKTEEPRSS